MRFFTAGIVSPDSTILSQGKALHCTQCVADHRRNAKLAQGARGGGFMNSPKFKKIR